VVKVLGFGLAKAAEEPSAAARDFSVSPTLTMPPTRAGMILGMGMPAEAVRKELERVPGSHWNSSIAPVFRAMQMYNTPLQPFSTGFPTDLAYCAYMRTTALILLLTAPGSDESSGE
jgi:hypothetical protein